MKPWVVLSPVASGRFDGIGDYAARLATALQHTHPTTVCVIGTDPLPPVESVDAVFHQYSPSALRNNGMRDADRWLDRAHRGGRPIVVTIHEYWPPADGSMRRMVSRALLRRRVTHAAARAAAVVVTQDISARELREAAVTGVAPVSVIPVGSNISMAPPAGGARDGGLILFGQPAAMNISVMRVMAAWCARAAARPPLTWIGRSADEMRTWWTTIAGGRADDVWCLGAMDEVDVSRHLQRATIGLAPYADGASARRTTLAALLQHGVPTVALDGVATDDWMRRANGMVWVSDRTPDAFVPAVTTLLADERRRQVLSTAASDTYDVKMSWSVIAAAYAGLLTTLKDHR